MGGGEGGGGTGGGEGGGGDGEGGDGGGGEGGGEGGGSVGGGGVGATPGGWGGGEGGGGEGGVKGPLTRKVQPAVAAVAASVVQLEDSWQFPVELANSSETHVLVAAHLASHAASV